MEKRELKTGDVLHFNSKGLKRFIKYLNKEQSAIYSEVSGVPVVFTIDANKIVIIPFEKFDRENFYLSSSPNWKRNPLRDIFSVIGTKFKNSDQFVGYILGSKNFESFKSGDVLTYCIENQWFVV